MKLLRSSSIKKKLDWYLLEQEKSAEQIEDD